ALVRDGGLVFLPGARILRFDRRTTVGWGELLRGSRRPPRTWSPLPEPPALAERIHEIAWELPEVSPEALYQGLGQGLRREGRSAGRPRTGAGTDPGTAGSAAGPGAADPFEANDPATGGTGEGAPGSRTGGGLAAGVHGLARSLHHLLGQAGAGLAGLGEKMQWEWVDHSALVRKLLREFREGDPARALRHAFPMAPLDPGRPVVPWGDRLPWNRAIYNLLDLLRGPGRGESSAVWRARPDLLHELTREYRKAAERALRAGDCRRAAYIYGKLLGEDRLAAQALQRGGLHRDAATLYLKKLHDPAAAAQALEAAGAVDHAIALYRQAGHHEAAGDLLRRIGDEDAALAEYRRAAAVLAAAVPPNHLAAGSLLAQKAHRLDLAIEQFQAGWDRRPDAAAMSCALELLRLHARRGAIGPIRELLDQGDAFYAAQGDDHEAALFYNGMIVFTRPSHELKPYAEELHDRILGALARRLRSGIHDGRPSSKVIADLLFEQNWSPPLLRDAEFAAIAARKRPRGRDPASGRDARVQGVRVGRGALTTACQATATGELFLGFDSGVVLAYHPRRNQVVTVLECLLPVASLVVDSDGRTVLALHRSERGAVLSCAVRRPDGSFRPRPESQFPGMRQGWLTPVLPWGVDWLVGLGDGHELRLVEAVSGMHWGVVHLFPAAEEPPAAALLLPLGSTHGLAEDRLAVLTHDGPRWILVDLDGQCLRRSWATWRPAAPGPPSRFSSIPLAWRHAPPVLELVGLDKDGTVHAARFSVDDRGLDPLPAHVATTESGYLAATYSGTSTVVAVSPTRIDWLSSVADRLQPAHHLGVRLPATIACFPASSPQEILAVGSDGFIARIAAPRRGGAAADVG
ncbi:MAG TPA: hypothetical protein VFF52_04140, partial [Isosphaeraceae bacterium]|nr:hypothetical protein [Isosphaeraceae bacterium]